MIPRTDRTVKKVLQARTVRVMKAISRGGQNKPCVMRPILPRLYLGLFVTLLIMPAQTNLAQDGNPNQSFTPSIEGKYKKNGKHKKFSCQLTPITDSSRPTLTLIIAGDEYTLFRLGPKADSKATKVNILRELILGGDLKGVKSFITKLKDSERVSIWKDYEHLPFVGKFENKEARITMTIADKYNGTIEMDGEKLQCNLVPAQYDPKAKHKGDKPLAGGPPLLMDLLTAFDQDGYELYLNTYLTNGMKIHGSVSLRGAEFIRWTLDHPANLQKGQKTALRSFLNEMNVYSEEALNYAWQNRFDKTFDDGTNNTYKAAGSAGVVLTGPLKQAKLFEEE